MPQGLNAFASAVAPVGTVENGQATPMDILGYYIFRDVITATMGFGGIVTDSAVTPPSRSTSASATPSVTSANTVTPANTSKATSTSESRKGHTPIISIFTMLVVAASAALFFLGATTICLSND